MAAEGEDYEYFMSFDPTDHILSSFRWKKEYDVDWKQRKVTKGKDSEMLYNQKIKVIETHPDKKDFQLICKMTEILFIMKPYCGENKNACP